METKMNQRTQAAAMNPIPAYKMQNVGGNDAEISMYGEVVDTRPVDFWTGQPVSGNFIMLDEFLRDLDELKNKQNITVHINSVGGDLYAGVAIYNRLKSLPANVTTVNDGLAASAGSIIFQAGNTRKVNAGSNIMIHQAMGFLYGYYNSKELKEAIKQLDAGNKAAVNIYAEASGRDIDSIKTLVDKETWLTGQEAVDAGFADELIESGLPVSMSLTPDRKSMVINGMVLSTRGMSNIPQRIPVMPAQNTVSPEAAVPGGDIKNHKDGGKTEMEIKNVDELRAAYPDFAAQIEAAAKESGSAAGIESERARIKGIEEIENAIADKAMINNAKYGEKPLTAEQLAFQAMQAQAAIVATVLTNMAKDTKDSGVESVAASPNSGTEDTEDPKAEIAAAVSAYKMMKNGGKK